jgi:hypothetical protein
MTYSSRLELYSASRDAKEMDLLCAGGGNVHGHAGYGGILPRTRRSCQISWAGQVANFATDSHYMAPTAFGLRIATSGVAVAFRTGAGRLLPEQPTG